MREKFLILDIEKENVEVLTYGLNEGSSLLKIEIEENEKKVDLTSYTSRVFFQLPNREILEFNCNIVNNQININITNNILSKKGIVYFEIELSNNVQRVTTFRHSINIE